MLIPLSWLKEYVDIKMPFNELAAKLSEVGLTVESWKEEGNDIIFDPEVTPNRPDWLSVYGIAREIAAVTGARLKNSLDGDSLKGVSFKGDSLIKIKPNYDIVPRITSVVIKNVKVKPSPDWLQRKIKQIGLRPINNLVDITNYCLWLYGSLLHVFDYDKIRGHQMTIELSRGGEDFRSLDGIDYKLPANAIIIKDVGRVIDLLPLKGGENTAASNETKTVLLHSITCDPVLTRRTSQYLGLRSDSSAIAERGLDPNGTVPAVTHALSLILELAGGEIASEIIDLKKEEFKPWTVELSRAKLEAVLGIKISTSQVINILKSLGLTVNPKQGGTLYWVEIPTFRNDIHIEEDLIEEVARIYGYNKFPKTLPASPVPTVKVAYQRNFDFEYGVKQILKSAGYSEIYTYSLISEDQLTKLGIDAGKTLRVDNPISKEYEYLRPNLFGNILDAYKNNQANYSSIKIYELGKRYLGETIDKFSEEFWLWAALSGESFFQAKGDFELLIQGTGVKLNIRPATRQDNHYWLHPGRTAHVETRDNKYAGMIGEVHPSLLSQWGVKNAVTVWALNYSLMEHLSNSEKIYQPIPKYPAVIEDVSLIMPEKVLYSQIIEIIQTSSKLISNVSLIDSHEDAKTLRITYLDPTKNLTDKDVAEIKNKFLRKLKELGVKEK